MCHTFIALYIYKVRSEEGLGGMSRALHRLFLDRLIPRNWSDDQPPILLNSWEAKYFDVNHANITEMARQVMAIKKYIVMIMIMTIVMTMAMAMIMTMTMITSITLIMIMTMSIIFFFFCLPYS